MRRRSFVLTIKIYRQKSLTYCVCIAHDCRYSTLHRVTLPKLSEDSREIRNYQPKRRKREVYIQQDTLTCHKFYQLIKKNTYLGITLHQINTQTDDACLAFAIQVQVFVLLAFAPAKLRTKA